MIYVGRIESAWYRDGDLKVPQEKSLTGGNATEGRVKRWVVVMMNCNLLPDDDGFRPHLTVAFETDESPKTLLGKSFRVVL